MKYDTRANLSSFHIIFFCVCSNKIEHLDKLNLKILSTSFKISMTVDFIYNCPMQIRINVANFHYYKAISVIILFFVE